METLDRVGRIMIAVAAAVLIVALAATEARGQMRITRQVVGSGGSTGVGDGTHKVSSTVGQAIIGPASGGAIGAMQGFWLPVSPVSGVAGERTEGSAVAGHPNPFSISTTIGYTATAPSDVRIAVYDMLGRELRTLEAGRVEKGRHGAEWDGRDAGGNRAAAGEYLCRVEIRPVGGRPITRTLLLQLLR